MRRLCFTAACNNMPRGQHSMDCPEYWARQRSSVSVPSFTALGIPSAPSSLRNLSPSFIQDVLFYVRRNPALSSDVAQQLDDALSSHNATRRRRQAIPSTERRSQLSITLDGIDAIPHSSESRHLGYTGARFPRWNPPDMHMDESDITAWRRHITERLPDYQQTGAPRDEPQITVMNASEHLASLIRQGYTVQPGPQQSGRTSLNANRVSEPLQTRPNQARQTFQRPDIVEEAIETRQTSRRGGRKWQVVRARLR
jgi:hypothetical protein